MKTRKLVENVTIHCVSEKVIAETQDMDEYGYLCGCQNNRYLCSGITTFGDFILWMETPDSAVLLDDKYDDPNVMLGLLYDMGDSPHSPEKRIQLGFERFEEALDECEMSNRDNDYYQDDVRYWRTLLKRFMHYMSDKEAMEEFIDNVLMDEKVNEKISMEENKNEAH